MVIGFDNFTAHHLAGRGFGHGSPFLYKDVYHAIIS